MLVFAWFLLLLFFFLQDSRYYFNTSRPLPPMALFLQTVTFYLGRNILSCWVFNDSYSPLLERERNWCWNASRNCFWDRCWGSAVQLLANFFSLCLVTVPEVFAKVNSTQFPSLFYRRLAVLAQRFSRLAVLAQRFLTIRALSIINNRLTLDVISQS